MGCGTSKTRGRIGQRSFEGVKSCREKTKLPIEVQRGFERQVRGRLKELKMQYYEESMMYQEKCRILEKSPTRNQDALYQSTSIGNETTTFVMDSTQNNNISGDLISRKFTPRKSDARDSNSTADRSRMKTLENENPYDNGLAETFDSLATTKATKSLKASELHDKRTMAVTEDPNRHRNEDSRTKAATIKSTSIGNSTTVVKFDDYKFSTKSANLQRLPEVEYEG